MSLTEDAKPDKVSAMERRPWSHGGDCLYKRWWAWVLDFRHTGVRHKITFGPLPNRSTAKEVAAKLRGEIIAQGHGLAPQPAPSLQRDKAAQILIEWASGEKRDVTAQYYATMLKPVLRCFPDKRLTDISPFAMEGSQRVRIDAGAPVRANRELGVFRHTNGSHLMMTGADPKTIMEPLGHTDLRMTTRSVHLSESHKRLAADRLAEKLAVTLSPDFTPPVHMPVAAVALSGLN